MTDPAAIEQLIEQLGPGSDSARLTLLYNAVVQCTKAYQADSSAANLRNLKAAEDELASHIEKVKAASEAPEEPVLASVADAARFLSNQGFKVKKSKVYQDKNKGLLRTDAKGRVAESEALAYAVRAGLGKVADRVAELDGNALEKMTLEMRNLQLKNARLEFDNAREMGRYIEKDEVHLTCATKCAALEAGLKNTVRINAVDWIIKTGGDPKHAKVLVALMYSEIDALLGEFGNMDEINVVVAKDESELPGRGIGPQPPQ